MLIGLLMIGCSSGSPLKLYTLEKSQINKSFVDRRYSKNSIKIAFVKSIKQRSGYKMHYSYSRLDYGTYHDSQWSNDIGKLLEANIVESLGDTHLFRVVLPYNSNIDTDYELKSYIYDFSHHIRGKKSSAVVSIQFNLVDKRSGYLIKSKKFNYSEPTLTINAQGYSEATNRIIGRMDRDLIRFIQK